jgi:exonuclease III
MDNMIILCWNFRSLNERARRDAVRTLVNDVCPMIVCLQETKLDVITQYLVFALLGVSFSEFTYLSALNTRGGILITARQSDVSISDIHLGCYSLTVCVYRPSLNV